MLRVTAASTTEMSISTLSIPRILDVIEVLQRNLTLDTAKDCLLVYFFASRALKLWRHVRGRGLSQSIKDLYVFIAQVCASLLLLGSIETIPVPSENPSACYSTAFHAQESGDRNGSCESRNRAEASTTGKGRGTPSRASQTKLFFGMDSRRDGTNGPGSTFAHKLQRRKIIWRSVP